MSSTSSGCSWTANQKKDFENALAVFDRDITSRLDNAAKAVGRKTQEEVKKHYELLVEDITLIEPGPLRTRRPCQFHFQYHVHAYERSERVSNIAYDLEMASAPVKDQYARVYITIGDGGNIEGLATNMREPQPAYSAYREASFGHAIFDIKNQTHAFYGWHQNDDGVAVKADSMWFFNRFDHPVDDSTSSQS
ncbi:purple acid phosphatase 10-like [Prunus avium]|uniref:Purple acid phosphatase 10-like n=1 Tax=Prunus avium TaxID=42229 RepID=A0A6P5TLL2_PRUAV|nr:purple acid phosphatase 10-like [Prunus avium]